MITRDTYNHLLQLLFIVFSCQCSIATAQPLSSVNSFAYQLQDVNPSAMQNSTYDLIIMDYSSDGSSKREYSRDTIRSIAGGKQGRIIVSYLSIGEAEDYRFYFRKKWVARKKKAVCKVRLTKDAPAWLDKPNPDFCNNYKTKYWDRHWKRILFGRRTGNNKSYLDRIIDSGFDGVFLDIIDGYEYWRYEKPKHQRRRTAARDMALLVIQISEYARITRGVSSFVVIPQNGAGILDELSTDLRARYLAAIDAIGAEDTFYYGDADENNSLNLQEDAIANLTEFTSAGKKVFAIDYLTDLDKISDFKKRACDAGFIPQVSLRTLDSLSALMLNGCSP